MMIQHTANAKIEHPLQRGVSDEVGTPRPAGAGSV
jgi:hypothetical protein